jgi:hypothetical protein
MGYEGEILTFCPNVDLSNGNAIVVNGDFWNPCGHMLLNAGGTGGMYFQIDASAYAYPLYLDEPGYQRYLSENGKTELYRFGLNISNPSGAIARLEQLMGQKWWWGVLWHNCGTFVEYVVEGGGGTTTYGQFNCPTATMMNQGGVGPPYRWGP